MVYLSAEWSRCHRLNFLFALCLSLSLCSPLLLTRKIENFQKGLRHSTLYVLYRIDTLSLCLFCANFSSVWFGSAKKQEERKKMRCVFTFIETLSLSNGCTTFKPIYSEFSFLCLLACLFASTGRRQQQQKLHKKNTDKKLATTLKWQVYMPFKFSHATMLYHMAIRKLGKEQRKWQMKNTKI